VSGGVVSPGEVVKNQFMTPGTHPFRGQDRVVHQLDDRLLDGFNRIGNDKAFPKWQVVGGLLPTSVIEQKCCRKLAFWPGVQTCWLGSGLHSNEQYETGRYGRRG
jgi:hypothetical protein